MLETIDLNAALNKAEYNETMDKLDLRLAALQRELRAAGRPVLVVFEGWDASGKGSVLNRILQPLDPRGFKVRHVAPPTPTERLYPPMRRFWLMLPPYGQIAIYNHSWYRQLFNDRVEAETREDGGKPRMREVYERIRVFERQLADDGAVILKFFLHISKKEQKKRFKSLKKDPAFAWKVGKAERWQHKHYEQFYQAAEDMLRETSTPYAPWTLVPATDRRFRNVQVAETLVAAFEQALKITPHATTTLHYDTPRRISPLDRADLSLSIGKKEYNERLAELQAELRRLQHLCFLNRTPVILVYEGWDAGGKGGNIRRLTRELDPRGYEVIPVGSPEGEEKHHHYLWRFWRALPKAGHFTVFDRSWYGRVLVERIEGFASTVEWNRAYREINEFETQLVEFGAVINKFWLHISKEEQLQRFEARQQTEHKQWKITGEDWRNRERWDEYWDAVSDMIDRSSTAHAPWTIIEGNDKRYARIKALETVIASVKHRLQDE